MRSQKVTILIPAHNSLSTIKNTFDSINILNKKLIEEIIYIDDNSSDTSLEFVKKYLKNSNFDYQVIHNKKPQGLSKNYNFGIKNSKSRFLFTMHQDIEVTDPLTIEKTLQLFNDKNNFALVYSDVIHPDYLYDKYNFWMKVNFSRIIGRTTYGFSGGKFDCLDLDKINILFKENTFKHSGEDLAFKFSLKDENLNTAASGVSVIHNHNFSPKYAFKIYLRKENQMNETYGVLVRNFGIKFFSVREMILMFHRLILVSLLFIPYVNFFALILIIFYLFYYSKKVYLTEYKNPKIFLVPFANLIILFSGALWNIIGFVKGKQSL